MPDFTKVQEKETEVRSLRFILSGVLRTIGEFSEYLTFDSETLPVVMNKLEKMALELKEAEEAARMEREKMLSEVSKWLPSNQKENS